MTNGQKENYKNLRENLHMLVLHVLGENYYTINSDVYNSDRECFDDIKRRYTNLKSELKFYKILFMIMSFITTALIVGIIVF